MGKDENIGKEKRRIDREKASRVIHFCGRVFRTQYLIPI